MVNHMNRAFSLCVFLFSVKRVMAAIVEHATLNAGLIFFACRPYIAESDSYDLRTSGSPGVRFYPCSMGGMTPRANSNSVLSAACDDGGSENLIAVDEFTLMEAIMMSSSVTSSNFLIALHAEGGTVTASGAPSNATLKYLIFPIGIFCAAMTIPRLFLECTFGRTMANSAARKNKDNSSCLMGDFNAALLASTL
uniref:Secreted protein n=1 Tax=Heterorhabditis bacteriophora TaxID=37862 RepID=A0A1I7W8E4_HETBA